MLKLEAVGCREGIGRSKPGGLCRDKESLIFVHGADVVLLRAAHPAGPDVAGRPKGVHQKVQIMDMKKYKTILYSRQKPGNSTEFPVDDDVLFIYNNLFY